MSANMLVEIGLFLSALTIVGAVLKIVTDRQNKKIDEKGTFLAAVMTEVTSLRGRIIEADRRLDSMGDRLLKAQNDTTECLVARGEMTHQLTEVREHVRALQVKVEGYQLAQAMAATTNLQSEVAGMVSGSTHQETMKAIAGVHETAREAVATATAAGASADNAYREANHVNNKISEQNATIVDLNKKLEEALARIPPTVAPVVPEPVVTDVPPPVTGTIVTGTFTGVTDK